MGLSQKVFKGNYDKDPMIMERRNEFERINYKMGEKSGLKINREWHES